MIDERKRAKFWSLVRVGSKDSCWTWIGGTLSYGYGVVNFSPFRGIRAHRISYILFNHKIPDGLHVLHKCDNRVCVNPLHLFLGTNADNVRDRHKKGRTSHKSRNVGEKHGLSILTQELVKEIRKRHELGEKQVDIGKDLGFKKGTIWAAIHQNWKHISH